MNAAESSVATEIKKLFGKDKLDVLESIFKAMSGKPPSIHLERFKADNEAWINLIEEIESKDQLLRYTHDQKAHVFLGSTLLLLDNEKAKSTIQAMNLIFRWLKVKYKQVLSSQAVDIEEILKNIECDSDVILDALYYMRELHGSFSGSTNGFPYAEGSKLFISSEILKKGEYTGILEDYFKWHYLNPQKKLTPASLSDLFSHKKTSSLRFFSSDDFSEQPKWFDSLESTEKALIIEIDKALNAGLSALPVIGVRALIENVMTTKIQDQGRFKENLKEFSKAGFITEKHAEALYSVIDAGSATMHRAYIPDTEDVKTCIEVVKHLLNGIYVLEPKVNTLVNNTPKKLIN